MEFLYDKFCVCFKYLCNSEIGLLMETFCAFSFLSVCGKQTVTLTPFLVKIKDVRASLIIDQYHNGRLKLAKDSCFTCKYFQTHTINLRQPLDYIGTLFCGKVYFANQRFSTWHGQKALREYCSGLVFS